MPRWRIALGVAIVVALVAATAFVVGSALRQEPEVIASEPLTQPPEPSPDGSEDPDPMPELHNTGDDFDRIIRSIEEFRNWLYRNPDPSLVAQIYDAECPCYDGVMERLELLIQDGVRFSESKTLIHEVLLLDQDAEVVALKVIDESMPSVVVDAETHDIVDRDGGTDKRAYRFLLVKRGDRWLVRDIRSASLNLQPSDSGST